MFRQLDYQDRVLNALEGYLDALKGKKQKADKVAEVAAQNGLDIPIPNFTKEAWEELQSAGNLCVMLLMLQSSNRENQDSLKMFQDRGDVHGFFPPEGEQQAHQAALDRTPNLSHYSGMFPLVKDSLGNALRVIRPMVVMDELTSEGETVECALVMMDEWKAKLPVLIAGASSSAVVANQTGSPS